jgi:predicted AlkP superfamily pyrophosphatase or phosphodiesterase
MQYLKKRVGEKNYLFVLTADHGICPIPEIAQKLGFYQAKRIMAKPLVDNINKMIREKFGLDDFEVYFEPTYFRIKQSVFSKLSEQIKHEIFKDIKDYLRSIPGIKNVWTFEELENINFQPTQLESFYKNQLYRGRSGDIICQPEPYCQITKYPTGTSHLSPYDYDTHVPLIIYQKGRFEKKAVNKKVWIPQLPVTLAHILHVGLPSASPYSPLPGLSS